MGLAPDVSLAPIPVAPLASIPAVPVVPSAVSACLLLNAQTCFVPHFKENVNKLANFLKLDTWGFKRIEVSRIRPEWEASFFSYFKSKSNWSQLLAEIGKVHLYTEKKEIKR